MPISQEEHQPLLIRISLKITCLNYHSNLSGDNELSRCGMPHREMIVNTNVFVCLWNKKKWGIMVYLHLLLWSKFLYTGQGSLLPPQSNMTQYWTDSVKCQWASHNYSTSVQVKAWCRQATSYYLRQCWPSSLLPYGVSRPQWVKWHWTLNMGSGDNMLPGNTKPLTSSIST